MPRHALFTEGTTGGKHRLTSEVPAAASSVSAPYTWVTLPDHTTGFNAWSIHSTGGSEPSQFGVDFAYVDPTTGTPGTGVGAIARSGSSGNYTFTNSSLGAVSPNTYTRVTIWSGSSAFTGTVIAEWTYATVAGTAGGQHAFYVSPAPTLVSTYSNADNSGGAIVVNSIYWNVGDLVLVNAYGNNTFYGAPTGFTVIETSNLGFGGTMVTAYQVMTTSGVGASLNFPGSSGTFPGFATVTVWRGGLNSIVASGKNESSLVTPSLSAAGSNILWVGFQWSSNGGLGGGTTTPPGGMTLINDHHTNSNYALNGTSLYQPVSAGATGTRTATPSNTGTGKIAHSVLLG